MSMKHSAIDKKLQEDTYFIGVLQGDALLLMRNALFVWFVVVPDTQETELYLLDEKRRVKLSENVNLVSKFVDDNFPVDKINVASIGNIVKQLHVHIVGRSHADVCWPGVVWGDGRFKAYDAVELSALKDKLKSTFNDILVLEDGH